MSCTSRRLDLMLEYQDEQRLLTVDMTGTNEANKTEKQAEKNTKVTTIVLQITRRMSVKVVQIVIGCPGDGIKQLGEDIRDLFNEKEYSKLWEITKECHM